MTVPEIGSRFGRGTVTEIAPVTRNRLGKKILVRGLKLVCDCGNPYHAPLDNVLAGRTKSCGCLRRETTAARNRAPEAKERPHPGTPTHGMRNHLLYQTWLNIRKRCEDPSNRAYKWYGARGITLCPRWHDVRLFIADIESEIGPRPDGRELDRVDNDGHYEPGNVRWATRSQQIHNSRRCLKPGGVL